MTITIPITISTITITIITISIIIIITCSKTHWYRLSFQELVIQPFSESYNYHFT